MPRSFIAGVGMYVPENVVTNFDLMKYMDTNDEWIESHTGIKERRFAKRLGETTATMGIEASKKAIENAGLTAKDIDFIIFATITPDYQFPGCGVLVQRELDMRDIAALDIRNQCSAFVYALSVGDQFIRSGMYKNILVIGSEKQSAWLDFSTRGRKVSTIFADGAGAIILQATEDAEKGVLSTHLHSDGKGAEALASVNPGTHSNHWNKDAADYDDAEIADTFISKKMIDKGQIYPHMDGNAVMKKAIVKLPEVINEALTANNKTLEDLNMLILNQSNLRIAEYVQKKLGLADDEVFTNIQRYGNTTAASIPIALCEAVQQGKIKKGDLVCLASYGSGFTWSSTLIRW